LIRGRRRRAIRLERSSFVSRTSRDGALLAGTVRCEAARAHRRTGGSRAGRSSMPPTFKVSLATAAPCKPASRAPARSCTSREVCHAPPEFSVVEVDRTGREQPLPIEPQTLPHAAPLARPYTHRAQLARPRPQHLAVRL
jgi:hypothetical protein